MNLVDDIYTVFKECGSEGDLILHISDVVDTVVTSSIHFDNVGSNAGIYAAARLTLVTGIAVPRIKTVDTCLKYVADNRLRKKIR